MTARTISYETRHIQTYGALKVLKFNMAALTTGDTIDLSTATTYKNTKAVVDAAAVLNYDAELDVTGATAAKIRFAYGIIPATGAFVPVVVSTSGTDITLTMGTISGTVVAEIVVYYGK
jgi:hypothetical protein